MLGAFAGFTYGIREGLAVKVATPLHYMWQRGTDGYLFAVTGGLRGRFVKKRRWSAFWEFEAGVSQADTHVPPRGTRFKYLAIGGGGMPVRMRPGLHLLGRLRFLHLSNNSLAGPSRNPDIEALGPTAGYCTASQGESLQPTAARQELQQETGGQEVFSCLQPRRRTRSGW